MGLQLWWGTGLEERSRDRSINSGGHKESVIGLIVFKAAICPKLIMMSCSAESSALTASLKPQNDSERQGAITLTLPSHTAVSGRQSGDNHGPSWSGASGGTSRGVSTVEGPAFLQWGQWPPDINLFMTKAQNVIWRQKLYDLLQANLAQIRAIGCVTLNNLFNLFTSLCLFLHL